MPAGRSEQWLRLARREDIVARARRVAMVVGTLLVIINYGDRLWLGELSAKDVFKMLLTYCVPYCVSTYAAVSAVLAVDEDARD